MRLCKNCGHPIKTGREMGNYVEPDKLWHWIDGWGTQLCENCGRENVDHSIIDFVNHILAGECNKPEI